MKRIISMTVLALLTISAMAQTSKAELLAHMELATGNYCNYPNPSGNVTPAPDGYEPFYVSHYGRHGARYMTDDDHYKYVVGKMDTAIHGTDDMENLHNTFALFRLIPMAGNVQLIFFRKQGSDDILVKFLMNENETSVPIDTDCYPFYHWKDVSAYYRNILNKANIIKKEN